LGGAPGGLLALFRRHASGSGFPAFAAFFCEELTRLFETLHYFLDAIH
jgi:hypothetical protein